MIKRLVVKGLNHRADGTHDLEFHPDLNLFTGPNGSGKTTLLKLIWYLISGKLEHIFPEMPFQFILIKTDAFTLDMLQVNPGKIELTWKFAGEKTSTVALTVHRDTGALERCDEGEVKVEAMNQRIAQTTKSSLFFPTFRRIEGEFPGFSGDKESAAAGSLKEETDVSLNGHRFVDAVSTEDMRQLLAQPYAKRCKNPKAELAALSCKILHYGGIRFRDGIVLGEADDAFPSNQLSAGEKQMLNFLCYNAFRGNSAVFIDEPEINLHVDWQRLLLPVLLEQDTGNQFFVATHSPFVAVRYPDREFFLADDWEGEV